MTSDSKEFAQVSGKFSVIVSAMLLLLDVTFLGIAADDNSEKYSGVGDSGDLGFNF